MMSRFAKYLFGAATVFDLGGSLLAAGTGVSGSQDSDARAIGRDWAAVGRDLERAVASGGRSRDEQTRAARSK